MSELLSVPPLLRTCIYYLLGVANVAVISFATVISPADGRIRFSETAIPLLSALFLGVAASNVVKVAAVTKDTLPAPVAPAAPFVPSSTGSSALTVAKAPNRAPYPAPLTAEVANGAELSA